MSGPGNPVQNTHKSTSLLSVSTTKYSIAGIQCTVYGLSELPSQVSELAILWLLHPRLQSEKSMAPFAAQAIHHWNERLKERATSTVSRGPVKGLIAVSFDQRNHGSRLVDRLANEAWKQGNPRHAQDMFSVYQGTAHDTSLLISHLGSYLPPHLPPPSQHLVLGISLGGHSAWNLIVSDPRITTAVIIIGCPDYTRLMCQRASKSRLRTWSSTTPAGSSFLGSSDFPKPLVDEIDRSDPAGMLLPNYLKADPKRGYDWEKGSEAAKNVGTVLASDHDRLSAKLNATLKGKTILNLSGGADKLVPYSCGQIFFDYLRGAISPGGWWANNGIVFDDRVFEGVGHETTPAMAEAAVTFIGVVLAGEFGGKGVVKKSRI